MRAITKGQVSRPIEQGTIDVGEFVTVEGSDLEFVSFPSTKSVVENTTAVDTITTNLSGATFSISGVDSSLFTIGSSSGVIAFASAPDFESPQDSGTNNVYNITVTATKNSETINSNMAITVINEGDVAPVWGGHAQNFPVIENATPNTFDGNGNLIQGEIVFTPLNYANVDSIPVVWSFGAGTQTGTSSLFAIDSSTGVITVDGAIDYENTPLIDGSNAYPGYRAVVNLSWTMPDGSTGSTAHDVLIQVNNAFDIAPTWNSSTASTSVDEGVAVGTAVYNPSGAITNPDNGAVTFSIVSQTPANVFEYVAPNIQLASGQSLDHETNTSHSVVIGMTYTLDGQSATTVNQTLTVNVNDLDDTAPTFTSPSGIQAIVENDTATAGNTICTISMSDPDSASVVFTIQDDGGAGNRIQLANPQTSTNMTLLQTGAGAFDWENTQQAPWQGNATIRGYEIVVRATDPGGNFTDLTIQLQVSNADDEVEQFPTPSIPFATISENTGPGINIGSQVTTISNGDLYTSANTFELLDLAGNVTDAGGRVAITSPSINTFQLKTGPNFFDYDTTTSHIVTVKCTDGGGNVSQQTYVIAVSNITEINANTGSSPSTWYTMENPLIYPMDSGSTYSTITDTNGGSGGQDVSFTSSTTGASDIFYRKASGYSSGHTAVRKYASVDQRKNDSTTTTPEPSVVNVSLNQVMTKGGESVTSPTATQYVISGATGGINQAANTLTQSVALDTTLADGVNFYYGAQGDSSWSLNGSNQNATISVRGSNITDTPVGTSLYYALAENQQSATVNSLFEMDDGKTTVPMIKKKSGANVQLNTPYTFITMAYPIDVSNESAGSVGVSDCPHRRAWNRVYIGTSGTAQDGTTLTPSNNVGMVVERGRRYAGAETRNITLEASSGVTLGLRTSATVTDCEGASIQSTVTRPTFTMRVGDSLGLTLSSSTYGTYGILRFKSARAYGSVNDLTPADGWTLISPSGGNNTQTFTPTAAGTYYYQTENDHRLWGIVKVYDRDFDAIAMKTGTPVAVVKGASNQNDGAVGEVRAGAQWPYSRNIYFIRNHYQESGNAADQRKISFFNTYADAIANTNIVPLNSVSAQGTSDAVFKLVPVLQCRNDITFVDVAFDYTAPDTPYRQKTGILQTNSSNQSSYRGEYDVRSISLPAGDGSKKYRLYARSKATTNPQYSSDWCVGWLEVVDANDNVVVQFAPGAVSSANTSWQTIPGLSSSSSPTWSVAKSAAETQRDFHNSTSHWSKVDSANSVANGEWAITTGGTTSSYTGCFGGVYGSNLARTAGQASLITTVPENGNTSATIASSPSSSDDYKRQLTNSGYLYRETSSPIVQNSYGYLRTQESFVLPNGFGSKLKALVVTCAGNNATGFDGEEELQFGLVEDLGLFYVWSDTNNSGLWGYDDAFSTGKSGKISTDYTYTGYTTDAAGTNDGGVTAGSGGIYEVTQVKYHNGTVYVALKDPNGGTIPSNLNWRVQATRNFNDTEGGTQAWGGSLDFANATSTATYSGSTAHRYWSWNYTNTSGTTEGTAFRGTFTSPYSTFGAVQIEFVDLDAD